MSEGISRAGLQEGQLICQLKQTVKFAPLVTRQRAFDIRRQEFVEACLPRRRQHAVGQGLKLATLKLVSVSTSTLIVGSYKTALDGCRTTYDHLPHQLVHH